MTERIQPENNRTFTTGSGNWAGDLVWHGDTYLGQQGYISVVCNPSPDTKIISLQYPAIKPVPAQDNALNFKIHSIVESSNGFTLNFKLTDGVYTHELYIEHFYDGPVWLGEGDVWTIEDEWTVENSVLELTIGLVDDPTAELGFDDFSLEAPVPARPDHLPLMGVH